VQPSRRRSSVYSARIPEFRYSRTDRVEYMEMRRLERAARRSERCTRSSGTDSVGLHRAGEEVCIAAHDLLLNSSKDPYGMAAELTW